MAYEKKADLNADKAYALGGKDAKGKPNPTKVEGYYLGYKMIETTFGPARLHIFQTESGNVGIYGKSNLNRQLTDDLRGQMVLAEFTGMGTAQRGKKPPYNYAVYHDKENSIDVAGIDPGAALEEDQDDVGTDNTSPAYDDGAEDNDPETDAKAPDEVPPTRAAAPRTPAAAPDAARQRRVQELLGSRKTS